MAHFNASTGITEITGALKKTTEQGVDRITVTRKKHVHDPLTGEIVDFGPNEIYIQNKRDYTKHPLSEAEQKQRGNWREACRAAQLILRDKSHPRYMELYHRWRAQLKPSPEFLATHPGFTPYKQFPPFVRTILLQEG